MLTNQIAFLEEGELFQAPLSCFSQHRCKEERNSTTSYNFSKWKHFRGQKSCDLKISAKDSRTKFENTILIPFPLHYDQQEKITAQQASFGIHTKCESTGSRSPTYWLHITVGFSCTAYPTEWWQSFAYLRKLGGCVCLHISLWPRSCFQKM